MIAILKKEVTLFFSSLIGYIAIGVFLITIGLFMWVLPDFNIFDFGYATLDQLFNIGPFVFMFLIPAITMRSFAEERKSGTIEILATKPITDMQIVVGKFIAGLILVLISILPTLLYFYTISTLAVPSGNVDTGATWGSYLGLIGLAAVYLSIGLFTSSLTDNQIVSFISSMFLCFFFYQLLDMLRAFNFMSPMDPIFEYISLQTHYTSISRGVVDTRDVVYFLTLIAVFIFSTKTVLESRKW